MDGFAGRDHELSLLNGMLSPVVREVLRRLPGDLLPAEAAVIGGYWTRSNDPEIDVVGAGPGRVASRRRRRGDTRVVSGGSA
ncbi:DUF234 domain-containing protein [Micromonospora cremea]|uniref:DUF234 domain-containing protein n=1 Tax=Micromonospora cremea TaxID=709881 RepID=UPI00117D9B9F|nr:DUF234 domain-containing protein [Micromonospora cremea]